MRKEERNLDLSPTEAQVEQFEMLYPIPIPNSGDTVLNYSLFCSAC